LWDGNVAFICTDVRTNAFTNQTRSWKEESKDEISIDDRKFEWVHPNGNYTRIDPAKVEFENIEIDCAVFTSLS